MNIPVLAPAYRWRRQVRLPAIVLAGLLVATGCGAEGETKESEAEGSSPSISAADYRGLERLYEAGIDAERLQSRPRAALRVMTEACDTVDRSRPLLRAAVAGCEEIAALPTIADRAVCPDSRRCASALQNVSDLIGDIVSNGQASRRAFVRILGDTPCAEALAPPPRYLDAFRALGRAYEDMAVAVESGDERLADAAGKDLARAAGQLEKGPSGADSLKRFRSHCAPES